VRIAHQGLGYSGLGLASMAHRLRTRARLGAPWDRPEGLQTATKGNTTHPNGPIGTAWRPSQAGQGIVPPTPNCAAYIAHKQARVSSPRPPIVPRTSPTRGYATADVIQIADEGLGYSLLATASATSNVLAAPPMS
jgi:hypothetical protein